MEEERKQKGPKKQGEWQRWTDSERERLHDAKGECDNSDLNASSTETVKYETLSTW